MRKNQQLIESKKFNITRPTNRHTTTKHCFTTTTTRLPLHSEHSITCVCFSNVLHVEENQIKPYNLMGR